MTTLLPRLPGPPADRLLDHLLMENGFNWTGFTPDSLPDCVRFGATGGSTVAALRLRELREAHRFLE